MIKIEETAPLGTYNTFGVEATAKWLIHYESLEDLKTLTRDEYFQECRYLHIGEGSNLLFLANFDGIVLRSKIQDLEILSEDDKQVELLVGAGWVWDELVAYTVERGYYGAENLSLIPGQVGSAAIQNIGAYGVEMERLVVAVHTLHRRTGEVQVFSHADCRYSYRYSRFKDADMADYIVTHVHLRLSKEPKLHLDYADVKAYLESRELLPSLQTLRRAIIDIRQSKLPDTKVLGNAGSFFMNPIVEDEQYQHLKAEYPDMPAYPLADGRTKLAAGWLIDRCGFKGYKAGRAGVYERQALVLVNHGGATGQEIASLAIQIQEAVQEHFGVELHPEVRYIS